VNCAAPARTRKLPAMRDLGTIDSELRLLAAVRRSIREHGGEPSRRFVGHSQRLSHVAFPLPSRTAGPRLRQHRLAMTGRNLGFSAAHAQGITNNRLVDYLS
jgi:hypothetical protein